MVGLFDELFEYYLLYIRRLSIFSSIYIITYLPGFALTLPLVLAFIKLMSRIYFTHCYKSKKRTISRSENTHKKYL